MNPKKIAFLGAKPIGFDCLKYLVDHAAELNAKVEVVLTKENKIATTGKSITELCVQNQIPICPSLEDFLEWDDVDFLISVQYHRILRGKHIAKAKELSVNLHLAPLPEYRGCNQFSFAILDEAAVFGTTIHRMDTSVDGGDVLFESRFPIPENCWVTELYDLTYQKSVELFQNSISDLLSGNYTPVSQKQLLETRKTSFHLRKEINDIKNIDLDWPKDKIARHVRATYFPPFEPPYTIVNNQKIFLTPDWAGK